MDWSREKAHWPHAERSRFVEAGGWRWHVQCFGPVARDAVAPNDRAIASGREARAGPVLLLHGTGSSGHSWRALAPLLAQHAQVIVPDLPGHAFTTAHGAHDFSLPAVAQSVAALLHALGVQPRLIVGHSAGAAIAAQMCLAGLARPDELVSINGALVPLQGPLRQWFTPLAKWLVINPLVPHLFAWHATHPGVLQRLLDGTGSRLDDAGVALYRRLVGDPTHAAGALRLMAAWQLGPLAQALPGLKTPLRLVVGERDLTLPPAQARQVCGLVPAAKLCSLPGLGHLAHEEDAAAVLRALQR